MQIDLGTLLPKDTYGINQNILNKVNITNRELDIVACLLHGRSTKKIASLLFISPKTVENHIRNIMLKINCNSRDSVIDFLEKSQYFPILKDHYINILIKIYFELELKKISNLIKENNINYVDLYYIKEYIKEQHLSDLVLYLEKDLTTAGIKANSKIIEREIFNINASTIHNNQNTIILILGQLDHQISAYIENNFFNYIYVTQQTNYYFFIFNILKQLLPIDSIDNNIETFQKQYDILFNSPMNLSPSPEVVTKEPFFKYSNKKIIIAIMVLLTLLLAWGVLCFNLKREIVSLKNKNHRQTTSPIVLENQIMLNLPPRNNNFIGREESLTQIYEKLNTKKIGIITQIVSGLGGIGKTQLATEFAHRAAEKQYYKTILWITAETPNAINNAYKKIADHLQLDSENLNFNELKKLVHNYLSSKYKNEKILFILDNVPNFKNVQRYLNSLHEELGVSIAPYVLITSRSQHWHEEPLVLDNFTSKESLIFIKKHLMNADEKSVINLSEQLHYFPLALSQAVAYIKTHTNIDDYLEAYTIKTKDYLNMPANNNDQYKKSLLATWNIILNKLSINSQKLLFVASYLEPDDIPIELFNDLNVTEKMDAIEELRKYSLIMLINNNKSFKIHRLLQEVVRLTARASPIYSESYWLSYAMVLLDHKFDFDYLDQQKWEAREKYLMHAKKIAEYVTQNQSKLFDSGVKLYAKVAMFMTHILVTDPRESANCWLNLLELTKKYNEKQPSSLLTAIIYTNLGFTWRITNKVYDAKECLNKALTIYATLNNKLTEKEKELINILRVIPLDNKTNLEYVAQYDLCYTLTHLGHVFNYTILRDPNTSITYYRKALTIFDRLKTIDYIKDSVKLQKLYTLYNLSYAYMYLDDLSIAETLLQTAKTLADQVYKNHRQKALIYIRLARVYTKIGKFKEADLLFKDSLNMLSATLANNHFMINSLKTHMGYNSYMLGNIKFAKHVLEEAAANWNNLSNIYKVWFPQLHLVQLYESIGNYEQALNFMKDSVIIIQNNYKDKIQELIKFQIPRSENWIIINKRSPISYWENMLNNTIKLFGKDHYQTARYHCLFGQALANLQQKQEAIKQYEKALLILNKEEIKHPDLLKFRQQNIQLVKELIHDCID